MSLSFYCCSAWGEDVDVVLVVDGVVVCVGEDKGEAVIVVFVLE